MSYYKDKRNETADRVHFFFFPLEAIGLLLLKPGHLHWNREKSAHRYNVNLTYIYWVHLWDTGAWWEEELVWENFLEEERYLWRRDECRDLQTFSVKEMEENFRGKRGENWMGDREDEVAGARDLRRRRKWILRSFYYVLVNVNQWWGTFCKLFLILTKKITEQLLLVLRI